MHLFCLKEIFGLDRQSAMHSKAVTVRTNQFDFYEHIRVAMNTDMEQFLTELYNRKPLILRVL